MSAETDTNKLSFNNLFDTVSSLDKAFADNTAKAINRNITARNWLIGYYIVNYEQNGSDRAKYGAKTLQTLAERLNSRSMSYRNLRLYRQFFLEFPSLAQPICDYIAQEFGNEQNTIGQSMVAQLESGEKSIWQPMVAKLENGPTLIWQSAIAKLDSDLQIPADKLFGHLSFTHFSQIMSVENPLARVFYELETMKGVWTVRELKRQIDTNYFERSGISSNPAKMSQYVQNKAEQMSLAETIKSPYVYEFLGLKDTEIIEEDELEQALIDHLEEFILELGTGFCFEARQKRILVDDEYYFCDLVFYNRILKCHVLIDLKSVRLKYDDVAQMNLYLSYFKHNVMQPDDNPPIGILMCTEAGKELVQYATDGIDDNLFVKKYRLALPVESKLTQWLKNEIKNFANAQAQSKPNNLNN
ncbi:MAG: DUF1016 family protein [Salinivirgaceae bacterium]|nr:DUF1016 family protein [Salinivirgaceae bacterium]